MNEVAVVYLVLLGVVMTWLFVTWVTFATYDWPRVRLYLATHAAYLLVLCAWWVSYKALR